MGGAAASRWWRTLTGYTGLGGLRSLWAMLADRTPSAPEDLTLADVMASDARQVEVEGRPVALREAGQGDPAVIFIHGFAEHLGVWRPVQEQIARTHRTVALDLWGFGASARPADAKPADWVREVTGVMDLLGIERAVLVGHSLGGRVALMTARAHPERVAGLVLVSADWGQAPHGYLLVWLLAHTPLLPLMLGKLRANPRHIERTLALLGQFNSRVTAEMSQGLHRPRRVEGSAACWQSLAQAPPLRDVRGLTAGITCPALAIWGENDPIVPLWAGQRLARKLGCPIEVLPAGGHFPQEEHHQRTAELIEEFLERLPEGGGARRTQRDTRRL
jgi:pimeloyl-ACP methyl ester carboxylesterase